MRNEPWVWPEVRDAGTSGAGAVPLRSAQLMGQQKKKKKRIVKHNAMVFWYILIALLRFIKMMQSKQK